MKRIISEKDLTRIISEGVMKCVTEGILGLSGQELSDMGIGNPADKYSVDYVELIEKIKTFLPILENFRTYIEGVEEVYDDENGSHHRYNGIAPNMKMRGSWNGDNDEVFYADELGKICSNISKVESELKDIIEWKEQ